MADAWQWDVTLFAGSAPYYRRGRLPYAPGLAAALAEVLPLDGRQRVLDVGCGPGLVTLAVAPYVASIVGVDPDPGMLAVGAVDAAAFGIGNATWVQARAEDLLDALGPAVALAPDQVRGDASGRVRGDALGQVPGPPPGPALGLVDAVIFAQSFHWVDQPRVAALIRDEVLRPGGALVLISENKATPAQGAPLPTTAFPSPPDGAITALVRGWLGPVRRAGQGLLHRGTVSGEVEVLAAAGYRGPEQIIVPNVGPLTRTVDELVARTWSLSGSAPHLFGERRAAFEAALRAVLHAASPSGLFTEWTIATELRIWRSPGGVRET